MIPDWRMADGYFLLYTLMKGYWWWFVIRIDLLANIQKFVPTWCLLIWKSRSNYLSQYMHVTSILIFCLSSMKSFIRSFRVLGFAYIWSCRFSQLHVWEQTFSVTHFTICLWLNWDPIISAIQTELSSTLLNFLQNRLRSYAQFYSHQNQPTQKMVKYSWQTESDFFPLWITLHATCARNEWIFCLC